MPLEDLLRRRGIRVNDLQTVPEAGDGPWISFDDLKAMGFYNHNLCIWNDYAFNGDPALAGPPSSSSQLLALFTEMQPSDANLGARGLANLMKTGLYDQDHQMWNRFMSDGKLQGSQSEPVFSSDQLLGLLVEASCNKRHAGATYDRLCKTALYNRTRRMWNECMGRDGSYVSTAVSCQSQLLGVLTKAFLGAKDAARADYKILMRTPLYDLDVDLWTPFMLADGTTWGPEYCLSEQLLSVIVEAFLDNKESAVRRYRELRRIYWWSDPRSETCRAGLLKVLAWRASLDREFLLSERSLPKVRSF
jgi:hypothetical protein